MTEAELIAAAKEIADKIGGEFVEEEVPLEGEPASIIYGLKGTSFVLGVLPL